VRTDQGDGGPARGRDTWLAQWASDLRLGVRLAIGGGRTSKTGVARLVLATIGIGLAVAVLLVAASAGPIFDAHSARQHAQIAWSEPVAGVDPLYVRFAETTYRDLRITGDYVNAAGPRHPTPPGLSRLPGAGEIVLSEALADLLAGPDGELLRPRFPQRVIGTIGRDGVAGPETLMFYAGDAGLDERHSQAVYQFGLSQTDPLPVELSVLISVGTVVLLIPVFVFIAMSTRIAGAERDRRLAALRLVGADTRQTRRIASAESLAGAVTGLMFGVGLFLLFRTVVGMIPILGVRPYPQDVIPPWPLVLVIVLVVPGLAVVAALAALRRTSIEPLGVVRRGRLVRRRLWWRLVPFGLGAVLILSQGNVAGGVQGWVPIVVIGVASLLVGIPVLLPWMLERVVARIRIGRPAAQLAVRRLQLDSGTAARVVSGVAVVLAGAIALQIVLAAQTREYDDYPGWRVSLAASEIIIDVDAADDDEVAARLRAVPGVREATFGARLSMRTADDGRYGLLIMDCEQLLRSGRVRRCADGEVFGTAPGFLGGDRRVTLVGNPRNGAGRRGGQWRLPDRIQAMDRLGLMDYYGSEVVATPGALRGVRLPDLSATGTVSVDPGDPDARERMRNALAAYGWRASDINKSTLTLPTTLELFLTIRGALLGGALFTLMLAGLSMLVLALEQVRERRRPLAALAAAGIPTAMLARSLLWQNAIPVLVGVIVAALTGIGLAALVLRLVDVPFTMDWAYVALFSGAAAVLVLLVTVLTLPTLRSATRLAALRSE
jgi:hypothetical protein